jgi:hypothetical protein
MEKRTKVGDLPTLKPRNTILKVYTIGITIILALVFLIVVFFLLSYWFRSNAIRFQSPIVVQAPIWVETIESPEVVAAKAELKSLQERIKVLEGSGSAQVTDAVSTEDLKVPAQ